MLKYFLDVIRHADTEQGNPGENHVRLALHVADLAQCEQVITRLKAIL